MSIYRNIGISLYTLSAAFAAVLLPSCSPRVATSFWKIGTPEDSILPGYTVIHAEGKTRHCYPIEAWCDGPLIDTYHELHHHGVAVESELMAYRIYFDKKQTIDPYCKRTPQLELAQSYWYPNDSLLAAGYGDDILRVSGTVGVGSVKYWSSPLHGGTKGGLYHIEDVGERQQWIVKKRRNKATIAVCDVDWTVPDGKQDTPETRTVVTLNVEYTMRAGHRDMRCDVYCSSPIEGLCTGVQTIPAKGLKEGSEIAQIELPNGILLASWGTDWPVNDSAKYAKETVGLGVFIPKKYAGPIVQDKRNNLCLLNILPLTPQTNGHDPSNPKTGLQDSDSRCHFYLTCCGATKENHPVASSATEWFAYLRRWAAKLH